MFKYGKPLQNERESRGLSQSELAKKTGIKQQNISRWEKGEVLPSIENIEILADFYGITIDELIGRDSISKSTYNIHHNETVNINNGR